jgi:uridine phosphorylase
VRHLPADTVTAKRWLLPGDPFRVERIAKYLDDVADLGWSREFKMCEGTYDGLPVGVCSTGIGGPSTAIAAHELHQLGATHLVRVGTCGALDVLVRVGDVCVASQGTITDFLMDHFGPVHSSDWFYDAPPAPEGALFVEMEAETLFRVAAEKHMLAGCICACSDSFGRERYEAGIDHAIVAALDGIVR